MVRQGKMMKTTMCPIMAVTIMARAFVEKAINKKSLIGINPLRKCCQDVAMIANLFFS